MVQRLLVKKKTMMLFSKFYGATDEATYPEMNVMDMDTEILTANVFVIMDGVVILVKPEYVTVQMHEKVAPSQKTNTMNMVA